MAPTRALRALLAVGAGAVLAGCVGGGLAPLPAPPTTQAGGGATTTAPPDTAALASLGGSPTTTAVVAGPGHAVIAGTVTGPDGPVPGATVRATRVVGSRSASVTVLTGADGTYRVAGVLGGAWRVRAWRAPDLAEPDAVVLFVAEAGQANAPLTMNEYGKLSVTGAIAPRPPVVGNPARLVVRVTSGVVSPSTGQVVSDGVAGLQVTLSGSGAWSLSSKDQQVSDSSGDATWTLTCTQAGTQALAVSVLGSGSFPLNVPDCASP